MSDECCGHDCSFGVGQPGCQLERTIEALLAAESLIIQVFSQMGLQYPVDVKAKIDTALNINREAK